MGKRKRNSSTKSVSTKDSVPSKNETSSNKVDGEKPEQKHKVQNGIVQNGQAKAKGKNNKKGTENADLNRKPSPERQPQKPESLGIFYTLLYFVLEVFCILRDCIKSILCLRRLIPTLLFVSAVLFFYLVPGAHKNYVKRFEKQMLWCLYWVGLGVLSSVGLGTGLHTFLIYLGPHIARVTLAAFECGSIDFPEPPYPDDVICPTVNEAIPLVSSITLWQVIGKVRIESLMWGAGTALGELPPYFMAKAARISGQKPDDEEYEEFLAIVESAPNELTLMDRFKLWMEKVVARVGFFGILLFASIPNPFFDLAGITCGHFLIPFWTFFGATLIGKAIVKMHVQMLFVVLAFSEHHVEHLVSLLKDVPYIGGYVRAPLKEFLQAQKIRFHRKPGAPIPDQATSLLQHAMSLVVAGMIVWFVLSLINSLAHRYHKRRLKQQQKLKAA